jgi:hypothetical protein
MLLGGAVAAQDALQFRSAGVESEGVKAALSPDFPARDFLAL